MEISDGSQRWELAMGVSDVSQRLELAVGVRDGRICYGSKRWKLAMGLRGKRLVWFACDALKGWELMVGELNNWEIADQVCMNQYFKRSGPSFVAA